MKTDETDDGKVELVMFSLPSLAVGQRITAIIAECLVNTPADALQGRTPWEVSRSRAPDARHWLESHDVTPEVKSVARRVLDEVEFPGRLTAAYGRSGGLLNLFNDPPIASDDDTWETLRVQHEEPYAAELWNRTPNPVFAELTPAEVWAGGGPRERDLLTRFLRRYGPFAEALDPPSKGAFMKSACSFLQAWTTVPQREMGDTNPRTAIRKERREILERKLALLAR